VCAILKPIPLPPPVMNTLDCFKQSRDMYSKSDGSMDEYWVIELLSLQALERRGLWTSLSTCVAEVAGELACTRHGSVGLKDRFGNPAAMECERNALWEDNFA